MSKEKTPEAVGAPPATATSGSDRGHKHDADTSLSRLVETTIREGKAELQLHKERLVAKAKWNLLHLSGLLLLALSMIVAVPVGTVLLLLGASNGLGMLTSPWVGQIGVALLLMLGLGLWLIVARRSISESFRKSVQDRWESLESEATGSTSS